MLCGVTPDSNPARSIIGRYTLTCVGVEMNIVSLSAGFSKV